MRRSKLAMTILLLASPVAVVAADDAPIQDLRPIDLRTADLKPVDAFVGDATVLSTSLQAVQFNLQQSFGFEQLMYSEALGGKYIRRAGGLWTISSSSTYMPTRTGYVPTIAPGTIFHIGVLPPALPASEERSEPQRQDPAIEPLLVEGDRFQQRDTEGVRSVSKGIRLPSQQNRVVTKDINVRFLTDEDYRRRTILSLVWRAAGNELQESGQAARGPSSPGSK